MRKFIKKLFVFLIVIFSLTLVLIGSLNYHIASKNYKPGETESNLFFVHEKINYEYLIMGISHGRSLSRGNHHELFENKFRGKMINLAQGNGLGGLENQYWYLSYFLKKKNTAKKLIFVLSPTLMFSNQIDNNSVAFFAEPIKLDFIHHIFKDGGSNRKDQIFHYLKSKLSPNWWNQKPLIAEENMKALSKIDTFIINDGLKIGYPSGLNKEIFYERKNIISNIIKIAITEKMKIIFVIPPAVFGKWPGHEMVIDYLVKEYPSIQIVNSSSLSFDKSDYLDHHHLNTKGMKKWIDLLYESIK